MVLHIALFELKRRLRLLSTWVYFAVFFALAAIVMTAAAGTFPGVVFNVGGGSKVLANAPMALHVLISFLGYAGVLVTGGVMGQAVYQDFAAGTHTLFFTSPISTWKYLAGRYLGALLTLALIFTSIALGALVTTGMPWVEPDKIGPTRLAAYALPYLTSVLPNLLVTGALFFGLAALTRRILPVYMTSVVLLVGYLVAQQLLRTLETKWIAALVDPFGLSAVRVLTEYWTVAEKNGQLVHLEGLFLVNRLVWLGVAALVLGVTAWRFQRTHALAGSRETGPAEPALPAPLRTLSAPRSPRRDFRPATFLRLLPRLAWLDFRETVKNVYFVVMALAGVLFVFATARQMGTMYGTETYPTTYLVLELVGGSFALFNLIIITFYSGELVWRERDARMHQLTDTLPVPGWLPLASKLLALFGTQVLLSGVLLVCGVLVQAAKGYFRFELSQYLVNLFGFRLVDFLLLCALAVAVQVVVNHKYVGHFVMVLYYLVTAFGPQLGLEHNLYLFGGTPSATYSDMNGWGPFLPGQLWFRGYWALGAVALALASHLLWVRGAETGGRWRLLLAKGRLTRPVQAALAATLLLFVGAGAYIFYNTNRLNTFETKRSQELAQVEYEQKYKALADEPQPRITAVKVQADLYPEAQRAVFRGTFQLANRSGKPVSRVHVHLPDDVRVNVLTVAGVQAPSQSDERLGVYTFTLAQPLPPDAQSELLFELEYAMRGFRNSGAETRIVENGTFVHSTLLPRLGYQRSRELTEDTARKRHGLPPRERMADVNDAAARMNTYIASDSDWVRFEATVSTSADQVALAPGYLQREWTEGDRRYFHYVMDAPILNFYSFLSGRWEVRRDRWNDVAIEVYYHPGHEYNLDRMVKGVKASLDYFTQAFGPYQHRQVRIIEFPRYASFAQSFPNTIPYSEAIGFIARVDPKNPEDVDYPFYVTAHEVAHQWWAHQAIGGNVQGATLLSETLSQYSALMVMKKEYGPERMGKFLRYELDRYLSGRSMDAKKEQPLYRDEGQGYIHYRKGSVVMYALQDALGEETVNAALRRFLERVRYQQPPFTHSPELIAAFREVTPPHLQYLVTDSFERITLYENRALKASWKALPDGKYEVHLTAHARKVHADGSGQEQEAKLDDWVEVGVLDAEGRPLLLEKRHLTAPEVELTLVVDRKPAKAGLDPLYKLVDRKPGDNTVAAVQQ